MLRPHEYNRKSKYQSKFINDAFLFPLMIKSVETSFPQSALPVTREREAGGLCCQKTLPIQNQCLSLCLSRGWGGERMKREYCKLCF